jgi:hypothetical protein
LIPQLLQVRETLDALVRRLELGDLGMRAEHLAKDGKLLLLGEQGDAFSEMVLGGVCVYVSVSTFRCRTYSLGV